MSLHGHLIADALAAYIRDAYQAVERATTLMYEENLMGEHPVVYAELNSAFYTLGRLEAEVYCFHHLDERE